MANDTEIQSQSLDPSSILDKLLGPLTENGQTKDAEKSRRALEAILASARKLHNDIVSLKDAVDGQAERIERMRRRSERAKAKSPQRSCPKQAGRFSGDKNSKSRPVSHNERVGEGKAGKRDELTTNRSKSPRRRSKPTGSRNASKNSSHERAYSPSKSPDPLKKLIERDFANEEINNFKELSIDRKSIPEHDIHVPSPADAAFSNVSEHSSVMNGSFFTKSSTESHNNKSHLPTYESTDSMKKGFSPDLNLNSKDVPARYPSACLPDPPHDHFYKRLEEAFYENITSPKSIKPTETKPTRGRKRAELPKREKPKSKAKTSKSRSVGKTKGNSSSPNSSSSANIIVDIEFPELVKIKKDVSKRKLPPIPVTRTKSYSLSDHSCSATLGSERPGVDKRLEHRKRCSSQSRVNVDKLKPIQIYSPPGKPTKTKPSAYERPKISRDKKTIQKKTVMKPASSDKAKPSGARDSKHKIRVPNQSKADGKEVRRKPVMAANYSRSKSTIGFPIFKSQNRKPHKVDNLTINLPNRSKSRGGSDDNKSIKPYRSELLFDSDSSTSALDTCNWTRQNKPLVIVSGARNANNF